MQRLFTHSIGDFKRSFVKYLSFELLFTLFASFLFAPLLTFVFNRLLIIFRSSPTLINNEVLSFGFSFRGIGILVFISLFILAMLFVEFGVIVLLSHQSYHRQSIYIGHALKTAILKLPKLIGVGIFQMMFLLLLVIPLIDEATLPSFIDINRTIVITNFFNDSWITIISYIAIFIMSMYLFVRWIFSLHFVFLQNTSVWQAMKKSWTMTKKHQTKVIAYLLILNIGLFLGSFILVYVIGNVIDFIESKTVIQFIGNYLAEMASFFTVLMSLFLFPINIIILTRLFYRYLPNDTVVNIEMEKSSFLIRCENKLDNLIKKRKPTTKVMVAILLTFIFVINYTISDAVVYLPWDVEVAAHRGDGYHSPENSMAAIKSAIEKGIDAVEIDVAITRDGVVVLSHDSDLRRVADRPDRIRDLSYSELEKIDIGSKFGEEFEGETIPTLAEVFDYISETETKVIVDVKVFDEEAEEYAEKIVDLIKVFEVEDLALVQSFNNKFLKLVRKLDEDITLGQILFLSIGDVSKLDVDFYTVRQTMLTDRFIKQARKENRDVWVWTVNSHRNIKEVLKYDIDGIITDYPERVYQLIEPK